MGTITINKKEAIKKRDSIIAKTYNEKNVNDAFKKAFGMWAKKNIDSTKVRELAWLRK